MNGENKVRTLRQACNSKSLKLGFSVGLNYLRLSLSCGSIPGRFMTRPGGVFDMSNLRTTFLQTPIRTKKRKIVLLITAIGGWSTFGKKLKKNQ